MINPHLQILLLILILLGCTKEDEISMSNTFDQGYQIEFQDAVQDKNFYLLSLMQREDAVKKLLASNEILSIASQRYKLSFQAAKENCDGKVSCVDQLLRLKQDEIGNIAAALKSLAVEAPLRKMINKHVRASGFFIRYDSLSDEKLLEKAWLDAAKGLNNILSVYGLGENPRYVEIDKVSYDVESSEYQQLVSDKLNAIQITDNSLFFDPILSYTMGLLQINNRDEGGRYEPMGSGVNGATVNNLSNIDWDSYEYSMILVLGDSPNSPGDLPNISIGGMARSDHGAKLFQDGKAPLLAFSGGHVRPFQTEYSEAIEMKKYVMDKFNIPENRILVDPHARHTTTNLRNISRQLFRYGIPTNKKAIVTSATSQSRYVTGDVFRKRCLEELGYLPVELHQRLNDIEIEFIPLKISLQADAMDPLDP